MSIHVDKLDISNKEPLIDPTDYQPFIDYHANNTIQLCELLDAGFELAADYNLTDDNLKRLVEQAKRRYYYREICGSPWEFRQNFNSILAEQYGKYKPLYELLDKDKLDIRDGTHHEFKSRTIHSDYPASQIQTDGQDYATSADDHEDKNLDTLGILDSYERYAELIEKYNGLDNKILDSLSSCFSMLLTPAMNY